MYIKNPDQLPEMLHCSGFKKNDSRTLNNSKSLSERSYSLGRMSIGSQNVAAGNTGTSMAVNIDMNGASGDEEKVSRSMPVDLLKGSITK